MRLSTVLILVAFSGITCAETFKEKALWKTSTYYCNGNPNFFRCLKPEVLSDLQTCVTYFVQNTTGCSAKYLDTTPQLSEQQQMQTATEFAQCSLAEIMDAENINESDFDKCFNQNYDETINSPILNK